ncbi:hypothetical protein V8D89_000312 [Ganoderma adspersum]
MVREHSYLLCTSPALLSTTMARQKGHSKCARIHDQLMRVRPDRPYAHQLISPSSTHDVIANISHTYGRSTVDHNAASPAPNSDSPVVRQVGPDPTGMAAVSWAVTIPCTSCSNMVECNGNQDARSGPELTRVHRHDGPTSSTSTFAAWLLVTCCRMHLASPIERGMGADYRDSGIDMARRGLGAGEAWHRNGRRLYDRLVRDRYSARGSGERAAEVQHGLY